MRTCVLYVYNDLLDEYVTVNILFGFLPPFSLLLERSYTCYVFYHCLKPGSLKFWTLIKKIRDAIFHKHICRQYDFPYATKSKYHLWCRGPLLLT